MTSLIDEKTTLFRAKEKEWGTLMNSKQTQLGQFNENTLVKAELDLLEDEQVFKLIGPLLMPVELDDAKENVAKRLEFILHVN